MKPEQLFCPFAMIFLGWVIKVSAGKEDFLFIWLSSLQLQLSWIWEQ